MALINITLQGKGGVGKSFVNTLLLQYYLQRGVPVQGFDTDPVNQTLAGFEKLPVKITKLADRDDEVNPRYFDTLIEDLVALPKDGVAVIDNGSSSFLPLLSYLVESQVLEMLTDAGHSVRLQSVITGGQPMMDTITGLDRVLRSIPDIPAIVWLNPYSGQIEHRDPGSAPKGFEDFKIYKNHKDRIYSLIQIPPVRQSTFGEDIKAMMAARLTFDEAIASETFNIMARQRLKTTWGTLFNIMEEAML
ncbi:MULTISPECIES: conjugal transfer protein TraL [Thalassospira]|uniref:Conjugal transfer protein TraL n=1 Tax=Thalassospira profundimaris TaxID=502049 RepID=A0A367X273_9PROT|nr:MULTISPECIES: conjugal transfer protein TraL [Thalassospira]KZC98673.1 conjugal transfer protein TraL [Thalassospira sp. MCCC 1A02898]ONH86456.1 conjugal transfer protein TraL [Thalassospira sp. MCCC 1A02803]RCK47763.1 conjugal transfer protein TraL [Thalassospira profundimaris]HAI31593.1 conjugal transfer protein TraL [Thalassospira sp.]|tara:strand:+ start:426 stop:1169 length:744 start_codon:yes stop_codon:yes gene_type:complete